MQRLVPELTVTDLAASLALYTGVFGFTIRYEREGFAFLELGQAALMLERLSAASWLNGKPAHPFGRGLNLQIPVPALAPILARLADAGLTPFHGPEEAWYRTDLGFAGQRQVVVADPDGYLLRFAEDLGTCAETPGEGRVVA